MFVLSFLFAVLLAISMKQFLFNLIKPFVYSENPSTILLNLPLNISSYIPLLLAGFFLNFTNYPEIRHYIWNVIWSLIFGITIFNFMKLGFIFLSVYITFPSRIILYLWENVLPYFVIGIFITIFSLLIRKQELNVKISLLPASLTVLWLILIGKLKLNNISDYLLAISSAVFSSIIIVMLRPMKPQIAPRSPAIAGLTTGAGTNKPCHRERGEPVIKNRFLLSQE